ncbi:MAG: methyl-accepting chemotaxis protein [Treponema sp.]|jgi:methyl-accepting chemotaxis protein|nr:methyl-accepting chemotaxis protein [Treponema sp.]
MKLKFKLSIIVIAILVAVIGGISVMLLLPASDMALSLSMKSIDRLVSDRANYWKGREEGYIRVLSTLANVMANYEELPPEVRRTVYNNMLLATMRTETNMHQIYTIWKPNALDNMDASYAGLAGYTQEGQYAIAYTREIGDISFRVSGDVADAMAYFNGPNARVTRIEEPFPRTVAGQNYYLVRMMSPIINHRTGEVVGGVGVLLNSYQIQGIMEKTISENPDIAAMSIYSGNGSILASYDSARTGKSLTEADAGLYLEDTQAVLAAIQRGEVFHTRKYSARLKTNLKITVRPFTLGDSGKNWALMIGTPEAVMLEEVNTMTRITLAVAVMAAIVVAAVMLFVLNRVTGPIVMVADTLRDISEGAGDLTKSIHIQSKDETGDLAKYFNQTLETIKQLIVAIKNQAALLLSVGSELAANMTESAAAINEISANIQNIKIRVSNQSESAVQAYTAMERITVNINKLNGRVETQSERISQSSAAIEEMLANIMSVTHTLVKNAENVRELTEASEAGRAGLQEVAADIQEIARESEGLLEINAVMENIASQTNLLSMNAAIEAAHAGEAGKGFAVVADEIRKLAENSGEQSKTISEVLQKIRESIDKIGRSTENVLQKFESIDGMVRTVSDQEADIRNAMENQSAGSKRILEVIGHVNEITEQVKDGSGEMLEGSKEVIQESSNLSMISGEILGGMSEMAIGAEQINAAINKVNEISIQNKEYIESLVREVSKFKVE